MNILDQLGAYAGRRVAEAKEHMTLEEVMDKAMALPVNDFPFERALKKEGISFICECKKASPSKGIISEDYDHIKTASDYEAAGADCISVLTEPKWFMGDIRHLRDITARVSIPCIRKDFTVDEYMIYEAKLSGAEAVLLICSLLPKETVRRYMDICDRLGISALVEAHDETEVRSAVEAGARIIGVNNRNLKDFSVDQENSLKLRELIPHEVIFVSESGVKSREDIIMLEAAGADAVLVGETLMRAGDKKAKLMELKGLS